MTVRLEADLLARMDALRERLGTPLSVQIRRALLAWLEINEQAPGFADVLTRAQVRSEKARRRRATSRKGGAR